MHLLKAIDDLSSVWRKMFFNNVEEKKYNYVLIHRLRRP